MFSFLFTVAFVIAALVALRYVFEAFVVDGFVGAFKAIGTVFCFMCKAVWFVFCLLSFFPAVIAGLIICASMAHQAEPYPVDRR